MKLLEKLNEICNRQGAGYAVLLDPDTIGLKKAPAAAAACEAAGADLVLAGGSLLFSNDFDDWVRAVKKEITVPLILFPGNGYQLSAHADGLLFMSLLSGRNPHFLIGEQVSAAPRVRAAGLDTAATAYLLIESGSATSVAFMSDSRPIPAAKPGIAAAHALAARYLGMELIYLEAGSGAANPVPCEIIRAVRDAAGLPVIAGGGIRTPEAAAERVRAGASFVVTGTVLEGNRSPGLIRKFADAVHSAAKSG